MGREKQGFTRGYILVMLFKVYLAEVTVIRYTN